VRTIVARATGNCVNNEFRCKAALQAPVVEIEGGGAAGAGAAEDEQRALDPYVADFRVKDFIEPKGQMQRRVEQRLHARQCPHTRAGRMPRLMEFQGQERLKIESHRRLSSHRAAKAQSATIFRTQV
jgi:hypothetical protein